MNKIEAVILDLDGTLLDDDKNIDEMAQDIIKDIKNDVKIVIASARQFCRIKPYLTSLDLIDNNNYTICFNGSLIVSNKEKQIFSSYIKDNIIIDIDDFILKNNDIEWTYYSYDERFTRDKIDDIEKFVNENVIFKIVGIASPEKIENIKLSLPQSIYDIVEVTNSESNRIEFVDKGMTKIKAIQLVLDKLGIAKENVVAIGDGDNDITMLEYVGCGIAMKNSPNDVKAKADKVTKYTNNENGVGIMLEELLKNQGSEINERKN